MTLIIDFVILFQHFHSERKNASFVCTVRLNLQSPTVVLDEGLRDHETEANAVVVHFGRSEELAKLLTEVGHLLFGDSLAVVNDMYNQLLLGFVVGGQDPHVTLPSELERILDQVY